ncbi:MAG: ABC transporter ATP-binding protein [Cellulomonadaceae bacterium]|nr:ABC transporter ATP-binding protein [Cellulomonadaceae bacterium]
MTGAASPGPETVIRVEHLVKRYGAQVAVADVGFEVRRGEVFGILGPNGAGKTTTVECLTGLRLADAGHVEVLGLDPRHDGAALRQLVGSQLQESELPGRLRVGEALALYASFYDHPADGLELAARLGLLGVLDTQFRRLSGGQKQRLSIALALLGTPQIAVLDELTTGLDPQARRDTWDLVEAIRDTGVTIVLVTHYMDEAERLCDRVALFDRGAVVAIDTPEGLARSVETSQEVRFRVPGAHAAELRSLLAGLPTVAGVEVSGQDVVVRGGRDVVVAVVVALAGAGLTPVDVEARRATLEDAFVTLTHSGDEGV